MAESPVYFRIPFRLISLVTKDNDGHVVHFASSETLSGRLACSINGYDLTTIEKIVVASAPEAPARSGDEDDIWRLTIDGSNSREFNVRNVRWAFTPTKRNDDEYLIVESRSFQIRIGDEL